MTTHTGARAASTFPVAGHGWAGVRKTAYSEVVTFTSQPIAADVYEMVKLPKGAVIVGGRLRGTTMETITTAGSGTLDIDIGTSVSSDAFGNLGVLGLAFAASSAGGKMDAGYNITLGGLLWSGPVVCSAETTIQVTIVASATGFTSAASAADPVMWLEVDYLLP